jgi:hypothetical protein
VTTYNNPRSLEARVAATERQLADLARRREPVPNFRDLNDASLWNAAEGQVPVYDSSVGQWVPGDGGGGRIEAAHLDKFTETAGVWVSDDTVDVVLSRLTRLRIGATIQWSGHASEANLSAIIAEVNLGVVFAASAVDVVLPEQDVSANLEFAQHPYTVEDLPAGSYSFYVIGTDLGDVASRVVDAGVLDVIVGQPMDDQILYSGVAL